MITEVENAQNTVGGIEKVEILEKPVDSLVGLKWTETRTLFGKIATETTWITDAKENESYQTRAESHGSVYISRLEVSEQNGGAQLTMSLEGIPQVFGAKLMSATIGFLFKKRNPESPLAGLDGHQSCS